MGLRKPFIASSLAATAAGIVALVPFLAAPSAHAQVAYAIGSGGTSLISFNLSTPGTILSTSTLTINGSNIVTVGGQPSLVSLDGIDFRPSTGQLYGYLDFTDTLYTVNTATGALTALPGAVAGTTNNANLGIDFNPVVDRVRLVNEAAENVVFSPNSSTRFSNGPSLFYGAGDPGASSAFGVRVVEAAYTNNFAGAASTTLYGIDYGTSSLVTISTATGQLTTVGSLGVTLPTPGVGTPFIGFDIFTTLGGVNTAYAILNTAASDTPNLFTIALSGANIGQATRVGTVGSGLSQVYSLAVTPLATAAPEPGSAVLALGAILPMAAAVRLRRRRQVK